MTTSRNNSRGKLHSDEKYIKKIRKTGFLLIPEEKVFRKEININQIRKILNHSYKLQ